jgi:hypothetical protein
MTQVRWGNFGLVAFFEILHICWLVTLELETAECRWPLHTAGTADSKSPQAGPQKPTQIRLLGSSSRSCVVLVQCSVMQPHTFNAPLPHTFNAVDLPRLKGWTAPAVPRPCAQPLEGSSPSVMYI